MSFKKNQPEIVEPRQVVLERQARRFRRRGEHRRAMLALREACSLERDDPRLWTLYGVACVRVRRHDDARRALTQALWLRRPERNPKREAVLRRLIEQASPGCDYPLRAA